MYNATGGSSQCNTPCNGKKYHADQRVRKTKHSRLPSAKDITTTKDGINVTGQLDCWVKRAVDALDGLDK